VAIVLMLLALVCFGETGRFLAAQYHHSLRIVGSVLIGLAFAIGAWFALRYQSLAVEEAREAERIAAAAQAVTEDAVGAGQQATAATQA
jgi:small-conductance mechanosensitive channel